jgi:hypothetical protein
MPVAKVSEFSWHHGAAEQSRVVMRVNRARLRFFFIGFHFGKSSANNFLVAPKIWN